MVVNYNRVLDGVFSFVEMKIVKFNFSIGFGLLCKLSRFLEL